MGHTDRTRTARQTDRAQTARTSRAGQDTAAGAAAGGQPSARGDGATAPHDTVEVARDAGVGDAAGAARDAAGVGDAADGSSRAVGPLSAYGDGALTVTQGADLLDEMDRQLAQVNRVYADLIVTVGRLARGGVIEQLEGMTLDHFLSVAHRVTGGDAWMLLTAARVLEAMPVTWCWFREGRISWSQLRHTVCAARRLNRDDRATLDRRIAASAHLLGAMGAEALTDAIDRAVDELRGKRNVERAEQREQRSNFLHIQPRLFGGIQLYGEYDDASGATIVNALDAASDTPTADRSAEGEPSSRAKQRAQGLIELAEAFLAGTTASGKARKAKPTLIVHVPLADVTATAAGRVELNLPGAGLPTVTARTLEALNTDADLRAVIFDGARPLAVSDKTCAAEIPTKTRIAVAARDRGCRFPGSRAPIGHCDLDHQTPRRAGGGHHPDGLIALSRRPHRWREDHGWQVTLDGETGEAVWRRAHREWRTLPPATPLAPDPGPPDDTDGNGHGEGRDPPIPF